jgi:hypothetical protein
MGMFLIRGLPYVERVHLAGRVGKMARTGGDVLAHLQALTWRLEAEGQRVWALAPYAEPESLADGAVVYRIRRAAESGDEGLACVDDAARAALLALALAEMNRGGRGDDDSRRGARNETGGVEPARENDGSALERVVPSEIEGVGEALSWAQRWLTFVRYMQLADGRFANFVYDDSGRRNLDGRTSHAGGVWWTGRALWALARGYRVQGQIWALDAWARCPIPPLGEAGNTHALFALAGLELLAVDAGTCPPNARRVLREQQTRARDLVTRCCEAIVASATDYFRDLPGQTGTPLWGYHQLHAVARAASTLGRADFIAPCVATVDHLVEPVVKAQGLAWFDPATGGTKDGLCAYCLSPITQGLGALYDVTGEERYRALALEAAAWLYGRNDAHKSLYDPVTGRCSDGLTGPAHDVPSANFGAESAIEAGFMELERRRLTGVRRGLASAMRP